MPKSEKPQPHPSYNPLDDDALHWEPEGNHPSEVSGMFKDDPTFEEFCEILRQQREEDYRQVNEEIDLLIRKE
jgi:hypothetical protein